MHDVHFGEITVADVERVVRHVAATESAGDADAEFPRPDRHLRIRERAQGAIATLLRVRLG
jgi:hypothetical protein